MLSTLLLYYLICFLITWLNLLIHFYGIYNLKI